MDSQTAEGGRYSSAYGKLFAGSRCEFASDILKIPQQRDDVFVVLAFVMQDPILGKNA